MTTPSAEHKPTASNSAAPADWYLSAFDRVYLETYAHRSDLQAQAQVSWLIGALSLQPGEIVVDFCCGAGRHSRALAASGLKVVGFDLSRDLLLRAREQGTPGMSLSILRADMRRVPLVREGADALVNLFTSFGYFATDEENLGVLDEMVRLVRRGGRLLLDLPHGDHLRATLVPENSVESPTGMIVQNWRWFTPDGKRVEKRSHITTPAGVTSEVFESVRVFTFAEMVSALSDRGCVVVAAYGDLDGRPWSLTAPRMVLHAEKIQASASHSGWTETGLARGAEVA